MKYMVYLLARLLLLVITPNNGLASVSLRNGEDGQATAECRQERSPDRLKFRWLAPAGKG